MKKLLVFVILIFAGFMFYNLYQKYLAPFVNETVPNNPKSSIVQIKDTTYQVEIADNDEKRVQGLSGRNELAKDRGMLFIFPDSDYHTFWMRGMKIPLDFIWIKDAQIVDVTENVAAPLTDTYAPPTIKPKQPVNTVLEINAGEVKAHGFQIGDQVTISLFETELN